MRTNVPGGIRVVAITRSGQRLELGRLEHGQRPDTLLSASGWVAESPLSARLVEDGALELAYRVAELGGIRPDVVDVPRDPGIGPDEVGEPYQRVAAYALVTSPRGLLLTQFNSQTHVAGDWGLPGGGLEAGESPVDGVHREVWEETGQRIELGELISIQSSHWIGRSPSAVVEDFHAVRIVYRASCPEPGEVVIHDVGGTTSDALWVPLERLGSYRLTASWHDLPTLLDPPAGPGGSPMSPP